MNKIERAVIRGDILRILDRYGVGVSVGAMMLAKSMSMAGHVLSPEDLRRACGYLEDRKYLVLDVLKTTSITSYQVRLSSHGCDVVEGTVQDDGIAIEV